MKEKQAPNNNQVAKNLYKAFHATKEFAGYDINVSAHEGKVNLQGIVDVKADIERAVQFAKNFPDVKSVENDLTISTDGATDNDNVYMEVTQELDADPAVNEENVYFTVEGGGVSLLGEVYSQAERNAAASAASKARGVRTVNNQLRIVDPNNRINDIPLW